MLLALAFVVLLVFFGGVLGYWLGSKKNKPFYPGKQEIFKAGDVIKIRAKLDPMTYYCELLNCNPIGKIAVFQANDDLEINVIYTINRREDGSTMFMKVFDTKSV